MSAVGANINTFSWIGSLADKLESDKALFEKLLEHPLTNVRLWAKRNIDDLEQRIRWERNKDEDGVIPGYFI